MLHIQLVNFEAWQLDLLRLLVKHDNLSAVIRQKQIWTAAITTKYYGRLL